jgi:hypothetical protein
MSLPKWLSNPYIGLLGLIASLVGLAFGFFSYYKTQQYREFKYFVDPERTVLIDSKKASDFEVRYKGGPIGTDVTSAMLAVWNDGKLPIRPENILEPIVIRLRGSIPILEAKIIRVSRDMIAFKLDNSKNKEGVVLPTWRILEQGDGARLQIVYAGPSDIPISLEGVIEGKRPISEFKAKAFLPLPINTLRLIYLGVLLFLLLRQIIKYAKFVPRGLGYEVFVWATILIFALFIIFLPALVMRSPPIKF